MTRRREREKAAQRNNAQLDVRVCINCGQPGPHYVGPSFGDRGFFICDRVGVDTSPATEEPQP